MHDRRNIRARRVDGGSIRGLAREFGASRNAVRRAVDPDSHLDYRRSSLSDEFEPAVRDVLADYPRMAVPEISVLIEWPGARSTLSALVARLRPLALERERDDLARPRVGVLVVGTLAAGTVRTGTMTVGRIDHDLAPFHFGHPQRPARSAL